MKHNYLSLIVLLAAYVNCIFAMEQSTELSLPQPGKLFSIFQEIANSPNVPLSQQQLDLLQGIAKKDAKSPNTLRSQIIACDTLLELGNPKDPQALNNKITAAQAALADKLKDKSKEEKLETTFFAMFPEEAISSSQDHGQGDRSIYNKWKEIRTRREKLGPVIQEITKTTQTLEQSARQLHQTIEEKAAELAKLRKELNTTTSNYRKMAEDLCTAALAKKLLGQYDENFTNNLKLQFLDLQGQLSALTEQKASLEKDLGTNTLLPDAKNAKQAQLANIIKQIGTTTDALHSAARDYKIATDTYSKVTDVPWWKASGRVSLPNFSENPESELPAQAQLVDSEN